MKIVIVGPGAMGSLFAAYLSKTKNEVWLLDKNSERAKAINASGIKIEGVSGSWNAQVKASDNVNAVGAADMIIICVKSYDTKEAIKSCRSIITENSLVLTLQNGLGNIEIIAEMVNQDRIIGAVTNQGATYLGPGEIRHAGRGETVIGRIDGKIPVELRQVREIFNDAGIPTRISRDIKSLLWSKLIINVGINALTAITRLKNGELINYEGTTQILREAVSEAVKVAKKKKIKLIYDDPIAKVEAVCEATAANISSMLQDILKKKKTEIDFINNVVVRQGQSLGIPTPVNACLVNLVRTIEQTYSKTI